MSKKNINFFLSLRKSILSTKMRPEVPQMTPKASKVNPRGPKSDAQSAKSKSQGPQNDPKRPKNEFPRPVPGPAECAERLNTAPALLAGWLAVLDPQPSLR